MPIKTALTNVRLSGDIFNEYLNVSIAKPNAALPAPYRQSATGPLVSNFSMSSLRTGQSLWTDSGAPNASVAESIGPYPTNLPYGTFTSLAAYTDFDNRFARFPIYSSTQNMKMSGYRGSFFPYFGKISHLEYSDTTYTIGQGKFWLKFTLIGGGGGGGGGDGPNTYRYGGLGGSGTQINMTCYVASNNPNQAIRIFVGEGGAGGYTYQGERGSTFWSKYSRPAGGRGWKDGGTGAPCFRSGGSGYGGGGGGASAIVWYPDGTGAQGYMLALAGGGGGGGGAGNVYDSIAAGSFPPSILAGCYSIFSSTISYPKYSKNGNVAGVVGIDNSLNGYQSNRGDTSNQGLADVNGLGGIGGDNYYSFYYKNYVQTLGGYFSSFISERFPGSSDAQINAYFGFFDSGGTGGGGGGGGGCGLPPPFYLYTYQDENTSYTDFSFVQNETGGGGGCAGYAYSPAGNISNANNEFAWRNKPVDLPGTTFQGRGPTNMYPAFFTNYLVGLGGPGGNGLDGAHGVKGNDGGALLSITNADHEGGLTLNFLTL